MIRKTNQSSGRLFPVILDVDHPNFFEYLEICAQANLNLVEVDKATQPDFVKVIRKLPSQITLISYLIKLYLIAPIDCEKDWNRIY